MYTLTLIDPDGSLIAVAQSPGVPRFMHITKPATADEMGAIELSDNPEPDNDDALAEITSFARIASAVWVDDQRDALYVRVRS